MLKTILSGVSCETLSGGWGGFSMKSGVSLTRWPQHCLVLLVQNIQASDGILGHENKIHQTGPRRLPRLVLVPSTVWEKKPVQTSVSAKPLNSHRSEDRRWEEEVQKETRIEGNERGQEMRKGDVWGRKERREGGRKEGWKREELKWVGKETEDRKGKKTEDKRRK